MAEHEEEYELVPLGPLRKLDKRLENLEKGAGNPELLNNLAHVIKTNQLIIDELSKANAEMLKRIAELHEKVDALAGKRHAHASAPSGTSDERMAKLEKRINSLILAQGLQARAGQQRWRR